MTDARTKLPETDFPRARTLAAPGAEILQMLRGNANSCCEHTAPALNLLSYRDRQEDLS